MNLCVIARFFIGLLFIISGGEKLIGPYQNFLYVVQGYSFLPPFLEEFTARVLPWIEVLAGIFLTLGLWTKQALFAILLMFAGFMGVVSQALLRKLPLSDCGCFGELIHLPPPVVLAFDTGMFIITLILIKKIARTAVFSLDRYLS